MRGERCIAYNSNNYVCLSNSLNAFTKLTMLSYVPVVKPNRATIKIMKFLTSIILVGPSTVAYADTNSITGGNINASPDEHRAPINEINEFKTGTTSANESKMDRKEQLSN